MKPVAANGALAEPAVAPSVGAADAQTPHKAGGWRVAAGARGSATARWGLPLAFVALPLYVILPTHYATAFCIPLATLGALLLGARLLDAVVDPFIGRWVDAWFGHSIGRVLALTAAAAVLLALGFRGLFFPPESTRSDPSMLLVWCAALLALTYLSYSVVTVVHQAWGARLGGDEAQRARIVSWREGLALLGVLVASVLPSVAGLSVAGAVFSVALLVAVWALCRAPRPAAALAAARSLQAPRGELWQPLATPAFRRLLAVYLVNGVASAVPATLVLFFIRDRLQATAWEPLFLVSYFAAGALSMPLWLRAVARLGLAKAWLVGMALAVATFAWAALLGADLTLPGALLAGTVQRAGHGQRLEGAYFGWWNFATKLNLALAAGIALPLLGQFGYAPGARDAQVLQVLTVAYCLLPCVLKLLSAAAVVATVVDEGKSMKLKPRWLSALALPLLVAFSLLVGCACAPTPADYAAEKPVLDLKSYFNGELVAHGIFTDRAGKVVRRFTVQMTGSWQGNQGTLDERFTYSDGKTERRVWRLTDEGGGRWAGRADDVVGVAEGRLAGNALNWRYTMALPVDGSVYEVQFGDWMYLVDQRVMLNKAVMSKFGIRLGEVTLSFSKQ